MKYILKYMTNYDMVSINVYINSIWSQLYGYIEMY